MSLYDMASGHHLTKIQTEKHTRISFLGLSNAVKLFYNIGFIAKKECPSV